MAARNLLSSEMITVSERWVNAKADRSLLGSIPMLAAMLPMIDVAHGALIDAQKAAAPEASEKELAELSTRGADTDHLHDRKGRGVWKVLDGLADLADSPADAAACTALRDRFMPDGLSILQASWAAEAGNAERVESELHDPAFAHELAAVPLPGKKSTLLDAVKAHVTAGRRLGVIEARRGELEQAAQAAKPADGAVASNPAVKARNQWIRVSNAVVANLDLVPDLDPAARSRILGHYLRVEQAADRRASAKRTAPEADPTPAGPVDSTHTPG